MLNLGPMTGQCEKDPKIMFDIWERGTIEREEGGKRWEKHMRTQMRDQSS